MFRLLTLDSDEVPEACCRREPQSRDGVLLSREECLLGRDLFLNKQVPGPASPGRGDLSIRIGWPSWVGGSVSPEVLKALRESRGNVGCAVGLLNGG